MRSPQWLDAVVQSGTLTSRWSKVEQQQSGIGLLGVGKTKFLDIAYSVLSVLLIYSRPKLRTINFSRATMLLALLSHALLSQFQIPDSLGHVGFEVASFQRVQPIPNTINLYHQSELVHFISTLLPCWMKSIACSFNVWYQAC